MKVMFVSPVRGMSGAEIVLARFMEQNPDIDTAVILPNGPLYEHLCRAGVRVYRSRGLNQLRRRQNRFWPLLFLGRWFVSSIEILRVCRNERPDVIQANHVSAAIYSFVAARLLSIPLICHIHDILADGRVEYRVCSWLARHITGFVAVSHAVRDALVRNNVAPEKISVIYNGIDAERGFNPDLHHRGHLRRKYNLSPDVILVGIVGMLVTLKGVHVFLDAIKRLRTEVQGNVRFLIIGDTWNVADPYVASLLGTVQSAGLGELVIFTGQLSNMSEVFADLDVVVNCSIEPDSLPTIILEAMAMGKIVVASNIGGIPEMIQHGVTGLLFPPSDTSALAGLLDNVIADLPSFAPLGAAARTFVRHHFSCSAQREAFVRVWLQALPGSCSLRTPEVQFDTSDKQPIMRP
jgi:glycosyltransferase involved in cell wall biosynthesis